ncbi:hypothetical protein [Thauera sp. WH-1]
MDIVIPFRARIVSTPRTFADSHDGEQLVALQQQAACVNAEMG